ncbi:hypothetical protein Tcan_04477 [Toxocara canis]|uniref:Uncharacterized protein n=1 Tax=Toxocara canis TaxID=6265 RepID=A0A0B2VD31_TOXCA|nr:hypothetical protein Tcan_04477 [Toxocara canis]
MIGKLFTLRGSIVIAIAYFTIAFLVVFDLFELSDIDLIANGGGLGVCASFSKRRVTIALPYAETRTIGKIFRETTYLVFLTTIIATSYTVVFFCAIRIFKKLNTNQLIGKTKRLQRQLNYMMLAQVSSLLSLFGTIICLNFCIFFRSDHEKKKKQCA